MQYLDVKSCFSTLFYIICASLAERSFPSSQLHSVLVFARCYCANDTFCEDTISFPWMCNPIDFVDTTYVVHNYWVG